MKKKIWMSILGIALAVLVILAVLSFSSTRIPTGEVVLRYKDTEVVLTEEEAFRMRLIFSFKIYDGQIYGCPYEEDIGIKFGDTVYAIATDGCYTAKEWHGGRCFEFNSVEFEQIAALFQKYCGDTVIY